MWVKAVLFSLIIFSLIILSAVENSVGAQGMKAATRGDKSELSGGRATPGTPAGHLPALCTLGSFSPSTLPSTNILDIPSVDPSVAACALVSNQDWFRPGGLSLSGDVAEGRARLNWIVADPAGTLLMVDDNGIVSIDNRQLRIRAGVIDDRDPWATLQIAQSIASNEGLLLVVQMIGSQNRYRLHIGERAPTRLGAVVFKGCLNLDTRYDSRINPRRKDQRKVPQELPPDGIDSLIALSPDSHWFNVKYQREVPPGEVAFHELAEAYAKIEMGLDYLPIGWQPGAHQQALAREELLGSQRPSSSVVSTAGLNWLYDSATPLSHVKRIFAEISGARRGR